MKLTPAELSLLEQGRGGGFDGEVLAVEAILDARLAPVEALVAEWERHPTLVLYGVSQALRAILGQPTDEETST